MYYIKRNFHNLIKKMLQKRYLLLLVLVLILILTQFNFKKLETNHSKIEDIVFRSAIITTAKRIAKISSSETDSRKKSFNFNSLAKEEENTAREELENDKRNSQEILKNDLNAAIEEHSNEHTGGININKTNFSFDDLVWDKEFLMKNHLWNYRNLTNKEINGLSNLGRRLFLHEKIGSVSNKKFLINIYKFGKVLEKRHMYHFSTKLFDPFEKCSVNNCQISYINSDFHKADAVLFHMHRIEKPPTDLIRTNFYQRWIWLSDESVHNIFMSAKDKNLDHYNNIFNWSMTYRSTSDIPVPYGRTVPLGVKLNQEFDIFSKKNKLIAILGSNCGGKNSRWKYVKELQKYIHVDTYGHCGEKKCFGHFNKDCPELNTYKFYLAFENSNCLEYITEKVWWNAFKKFSIPIVLGTSKQDYMKLLPPHSFIYAEDFQTPKDLAKHIKFLSENKDAFNEYHKWRKEFRVINEHGYFQTDVFHYCRICEALNYNSPEPKTYHSMKSFWNITSDCYPPTWMKNVPNL